ncbi:MAG: hypothetical protein K9I69_05295 [Ignavibacteriales bacterium]|nr:hypothetical protein [Ignavibacteriales bacterium]MCF8305576.1 hypothetical protein [Ignavibacteriales bacterium]MCF8315298.1 hypothetical protein [Ignavibacteriales bacterium]MCF8436810.1 hypothetical protein [Ignavibacteriales bacterium]
MILLFLVPFITTIAQIEFEQKLDLSYTNAKKGLFWAYSNIPDSKQTLDRDLIDKDKLVASVKISKEVMGVKITSTGIYESIETRLTVYRSYDSLIARGHIKKSLSD